MISKSDRCQTKKKLYDIVDLLSNILMRNLSRMV